MEAEVMEAEERIVRSLASIEDGTVDPDRHPKA